MVVARDVEAVRQALHQGQLTVLDPATGYHQSMHADCPRDGQRAVIYMTTKHDGVITEVTFFCPSCGQHFVAPIENIYLR